MLLPRDYVRAVQRAGGAGAAARPGPRRPPSDPDELLDRIDGLVLAGGVDVGDDPERDAFEMALGRRALERDLPLLGICRGMQVMNVAAGGTLIEHVPDVVGHEDHRHTRGQWTDHDVRLTDGSLAARAAGSDRHRRQVPPPPGGRPRRRRLHRHRLGRRRRAARGDGVRRAHRFALGVQWHPEADEESRLIARARRRGAQPVR